MKNTYVINGYEDFACLQGKCPQTCCKNWIISIDEDTYSVMKREKGRQGFFLRHFSKKEKNGNRSIRKICGRCPYYSREGLCRHQLDGRRDLMPLICRMYPRRVVRLGTKEDSRVEVTLELSCISASEWFLKSEGNWAFSPYIQNNKKSIDDFSLEVLWYKNNDSKSYLDFLIALRERLVSEFNDSVNLLQDISDAFSYIREIQDLLMKHTEDGEAGQALTEKMKEPCLHRKRPDGDKQPNNDKLTGGDKQPNNDKLTGGDKKTDGHNLLIPFITLNEILYTYFDPADQRRKNPVLSNLLRRYDYFFGKKTPFDGAEKYMDGIKNLLKEEAYRKKYNKYFTYCLMEEIPEAYEDYYLIGKYVFSALYTELLMLFDMLGAGRYSEAQILSAVERGFRHSPALKKNVLSILRKEVL